MPFKSLAALSAARGKAVIKESKSERVHFSTAAGIAPVCVVSAIEPVVMPMPRSVTASTPVFGAAYAAVHRSLLRLSSNGCLQPLRTKSPRIPGWHHVPVARQCRPIWLRSSTAVVRHECRDAAKSVHLSLSFRANSLWISPIFVCRLTYRSLIVLQIDA